MSGARPIKMSYTRDQAMFTGFSDSTYVILPENPLRVFKIFFNCAVFISFIFFAFILRAEIITDDMGRRVEVNTPVESIVSLSPADTEIIYWLGLESHLTAVSLNCDYPLAVRGLDRVGSFLNPDIEKIAAYKPDVVISGGGIQKKIMKKLEKFKIPVLVLYPRDIDKGMVKDMTIIGGLAGDFSNVKSRIKEYIRYLKDASAAPDARQFRVYMEIWGQPVMAVGGKSFINDELKLAGGKNIFAGSKIEYPKISPEEVVKLNPDVIILLYKPEKNFKDRPYFKLTKAGENNNIYVVEDPDSVLRAGPRIPAGVKQLRDILDRAADK
jgi:iron complex transport system substrate-binding protein